MLLKLRTTDLESEHVRASYHSCVILSPLLVCIKLSYDGGRREPRAEGKGQGWLRVHAT